MLLLLKLFLRSTTLLHPPKIYHAAADAPFYRSALSFRSQINPGATAEVMGDPTLVSSGQR